MRIGVIGLGLIGGSIAKCLSKKAGFEIVAMNRTEQPLIAAKEDGVITGYSTFDFSIFKACSVVFVCVPVGKIVEYVDKLAPYVGKDCVITDVGSTKAKISAAVNREDVTFIGGHPMAGSEKFGYTAANDKLFENAYYILTPSEHESPMHIETLTGLIRLMGATPVTLNAVYHDRVAALISHGPHVVAAILVNLIRQKDDAAGSMHKLSAGGFKDTTRIASSDPTMWQNISLENKGEILAFIKDFREHLDQYESSLMTEDSEAVYSFFAEAKKFRDSFLQR